MSNDKMVFEKALKESNITLMNQVPKSDVHNHSGRGGRLSDLNPKIKPFTGVFESLQDMNRWFRKNVKVHCSYKQRVEAAFLQAARDNIQLFTLSFEPSDINSLGGMEQFIKILKTYKERYIPNGVFEPELAFIRYNLSEEDVDEIKEIISQRYFKSIDMYGDEVAGPPVANYKSLYQYAKSFDMKLKMHVGEFGNSEHVIRAVEILELDEVHHGIAAADSKVAMKYLADHQIILNVCPTSNIMLGRAGSYANHPIKTLHDNGVLVTINTDDLSIFNSTVSEEYIRLYHAKAFTVEELDKIRIGGLTAYEKYQEVD